MDIEKEINDRVGEVRTDTLDLSFGEIVNLHVNNELIIQPEYQRLFRWSDQQKSHLIESVLLELPIPQIFVIENEDGVFELIDGLQRVSTILQFVEPQSIEKEPLKLQGCTLISGLNNYYFHDMPLSLRLRLKRTSIRTVVIKKQSKGFLRYEMFKRLNTGGANLEPQEVRNCSARMLGEEGVKFYTFITNLSKRSYFSECTKSLPDAEKEKKGLEELVLRFFATKNYRDKFKGSVRDWLDDYMEAILLDKIDFDYDKEELDFENVFKISYLKLTENAFLRYRSGNPVGSLPPAYFEAISMGVFNTLDVIESKSKKDLRNKITEIVQSADFRAVTGPGANSREKLQKRIDIVEKGILSI
ncbi:hypothetical protein ADIMK_2533 [Marinobacterium lacunae]|uniref:GmrSD restriction endonucleases N-terminal domain-containing protein n=1 Tax=Marinobacterium lacunae TaxID=1232683 RepID=A0A081FWV4_9GAMM|nr:DUF262 domain-containing protein [Marinobacterium lacunae]KEA63009.1 hypothetical protein ADIMK_2533 [Marinobacterium lacunae]